MLYRKETLDGRANQFEEFYHKYKNLMFVAANNILHDSFWAEDAVAEAFLKIYRNFDKLEVPISPSGKRFAVIITENTAIDLLRKAKREKWEAPESADTLVYNDNDEQSFLSILELLPPEYRTVFELKYGNNYSCKEIAEIIGCSKSKVEQILCRGRKMLRRIIVK